MPTYSAGTATIDVIPSLKNFHRKIEAQLKGMNDSVSIPVQANTKGFKESIKAATTGNSKVTVDVDADTKAAQARLDALTARRKTIKLQYDADIAKAQAKLDELTKKREAGVDVTADITKAQARIDQLTTKRRSVEASMDLDTARAEARLAALSQRKVDVKGRADVDTSPALAKLDVLSARAVGIGALIAGGLSVVGPGAAAAAGGLGVLGGVIGTVVLGSQGLGDTLTALSAAQDEAGNSASSLAQQQVSAARQIASAQHAVEQARTSLSRAYEDSAYAATQSDKAIADAIKQVSVAEKSELSAEKSLLQAQKDLNDARAEAVKSIRDLRYEISDGALDERSAVLDLKDAKEALDTALANGVGGEELERLQIAYERQSNTLDEIRNKNSDLAEQQAQVNATGVDGTDAVVSAQQRLADAQDQVASASQSVQDAQAGVIQAQQAAARQQVESNRSIADAQDAMAQAQLQLSQAVQDSSSQGSSATDKLNEAMSKLSPNARALVSTIQALKPAWSAMQNQVQDALFDNASATLTSFSNSVLPSMTQNLSAVAGGVNTVATDMLNWASSGPFIDQMNAFFAALVPLITAAVGPMQTWIGLFLQVATAALPGLQAVMGSISAIGQQLSMAFGPLIQSGALTTALNNFANLVASLGPLLAVVVTSGTNLWNVLGPMLTQAVQALTPVVGALIDDITNLLIKVQPLFSTFMGWIQQNPQLVASFIGIAGVVGALSGPLSSLLGMFSNFAPILKFLGGPLGIIIGLLATALATSAPFRDAFGQLLSVVGNFASTLMTALMPILTQVAQIIAGALTVALNAILPVLPMILNAFMSIVNVLLPLLPLIANLAATLLAALMPAVVNIVPALIMLINAILPILPPLVNLIATILPILVSMFTSLIPIVVAFANILAGTLATVISLIVVPIINLIVNTLKVLADAFGFVWMIIKPVIDAFGGAVSFLWGGVIKPAFDKIKEGTDRVGDWFKSMGDTVGGIWDGLKRVVRGGIQGVIDIVYNNGIRALANAVIKYIPGVDYLPEIKVPEFASGGFVSGPGGPTADLINARLSNGEFVVNAAATARWLPFLEYINGGKGSPGQTMFASGGAVTATASTAGSPTTSGDAVTIDPAAIAALGDAFTALATTVSAVTLPAIQAFIDLINASAIPTVIALVNQNLLLQANEQALAANITLYWQQIAYQVTANANAVTARQTTLEQQMSVSWANIQNATWNSVNQQTSAMNALLNGMGAVRNAATATADWTVSQWARMTEAAAVPVRWILNNPFNAGIIAAWNTLDSQFAFNQHVNPVPVAFATGGRVFGAGTGTSDSINARLSRGEFVVREAIAKRIYPFLTALNGGQAEALQATGYATGGIVADTGSAQNAAIANAMRVAQSMNGRPYIWGAASPAGADCSGYQSIIYNALHLDPNPYHRVFTTATLANAGAFGFIPGLSSSYAIGVRQGNPGHTAGTLAGINVESSGSVMFGGRAHGADDSQFTSQWSLPFVGGSFVSGGGSFDPSAIVNGAFAQTYDMIGQIGSLFPGNYEAFQAGGIVRAGADRTKQAAIDKLSSLFSSSAAAGSPEVVAAVRAAAAQYGWDSGPQWDALSWIIGKESSWNPLAQNPASSAFGLFQFLDDTWAGLGFAKTANAGIQAMAGTKYIKQRYIDPLGARAFWQSHNWYDSGGIASGVGVLQKNTLQPERVLSPRQTRAFEALVSSITSDSYLPAGSSTTNNNGTTLTQYVYAHETQDAREVANDASRRIAASLRSS